MDAEHPLADRLARETFLTSRRTLEAKVAARLGRPADLGPEHDAAVAELLAHLRGLPAEQHSIAMTVGELRGLLADIPDDQPMQVRTVSRLGDVGLWLRALERDPRTGQLCLRAGHVPPPEPEWGVRHPDGDVEPAGCLGENRARMLARRYGGQVVRRVGDGPWGEA
jgi:hypothetical protein